MSFQTSALIVTWVALLLLALVVSGLVRQVHALSSGAARPRLGIRPGERAPGADRLGLRPPAVLLFLSEDCRTCADVLDEATRTPADVALHALYAGAAPASNGRGTAGDNGHHRRVTVHAGQAELFERYDAVATPFAVVVGPDGRVARSEPVGSRSALRAVLGGVP